MDKIDISKLKIDELVHYEQAANVVCSRYENNIRLYDGSLKVESDEYKKYDMFNRVRLKILEEMENRLSVL